MMFPASYGVRRPGNPPILIECTGHVQAAVGFDFDHTLGIDNKLERVAFLRIVDDIAAATGITLDRERATLGIDREIALYRGGRCSLDQAITLAFDDALGDGAGQRERVDAFRTLAVAMAPQLVQPSPGVSALLERLDALSIPYAILTNGWNPLQQRKADCIGFKKPVFVSDDIGVRKPNVHAFNILRDYFALPAHSIWYVGDDPTVDIMGALNAGMNAIWFNENKSKFPTDIPGPTAIVTDITSVLDYLSSATSVDS